MNYLKMTGYIVRTASDNWTLGYEGENNARTLRVKTTDSLTNFATVNLLIDTLDCGAMTIQTVSNYRILEMVITEEMLGLPGLKTCQLVMKNTAGSVVLKTNQFYMYVKSSNVTDRIYISTEDTIKAALTALINDGVLEDLSIEDGSITTSKIANGAITQAKLDPNISFEADDELDATSTNAIQNKVVTAAISEVNESLPELYKHENIAISHTGTGAASSAATIHWGIRIPYTIGEGENWSISVVPQFTTQEGTYTATRYKSNTGITLASGDEVEVVETKTAEKGSPVTFDKIGNDEIITIVASSGQTQRSTDVAEKIDVAMGKVDPQTGIYTSFSGQLSGEYTLTKYKSPSSGSLLLFGKKITLIGDSITEKTGRAAVTHGQYLDRWTGCNVQNLGVSSTGFSTNNKYKSRISRISADVDIIGVAASFNDMRNSVGTASDTASDETVCGYANEFFDLLLTSFPAASIVCYSEGAWESYRPGVEKSDTYMTEMEKICKSKGIAWDCSLYNGCALRPWIEANRNIYYVGEEGQYEGVVDNIHPNSAGQKIIANYLRCLFEKYLTGLD